MSDGIPGQKVREKIKFCVFDTKAFLLLLAFKTGVQRNLSNILGTERYDTTLI
jgi:hypothetical protein